LEKIILYIIFIFTICLNLTATGQDICKNKPANSEVGSFEVIGGIENGCLPFSLSLKDLSGGSNIKYEFNYDGISANNLNLTGNSAVSFTYLIAKTYTILQYGKKNGKNMYACKNIVVNENIPPKFSYTQCGDEIEIIVPKSKDNIDNEFMLSWGVNFSEGIKIKNNELPFVTIKKINLPTVLELKGINSSLTGCSFSKLDTLKSLNRSFYPEGFKLPYDPNINETIMLSKSKGIFKFKGSEDQNGYDLNIKENKLGSNYSVLKNKITPGNIEFTLPDSTKSYCFYFSRNATCGFYEYSSEVCTVNQISSKVNNEIILISWPKLFDISNYQINSLNANSFTKSIYIEKYNSGNFQLIPINNLNVTSFSDSLNGCINQMKYRLKLIYKGVFDDFNFETIIYSDWIKPTVKTLPLPRVENIIATFEKDNLNTSFSFKKPNLTNLIKNFYLYKFTKNDSLIVDSIQNLKKFIVKSDFNENSFFKINYIDECNQVSGVSNKINAITLRVDEKNNLSWFKNTPFSDVNILNYELEILQDTLFKSINIFPINIYSTKVKYQKESIIRLKVNSKNGDVSFSNFIIIPKEFNIILPNVFSPNGDSINDVFQIISDTSKLKRFNISIYNRWGELIFSENNSNFKWGGVKEFNEEFVYIISGSIDNKFFKKYGTISQIK
jgi:gliding motility-associated-like protein